MVKILNCYLYAKKSYGTLSKGAIFLGQPCILVLSIDKKYAFSEIVKSIKIFWVTFF